MPLLYWELIEVLALLLFCIPLIAWQETTKQQKVDAFENVVITIFIMLLLVGADNFF